MTSVVGFTSIVDVACRMIIRSWDFIPRSVQGQLSPLQSIATGLNASHMSSSLTSLSTPARQCGTKLALLAQTVSNPLYVYILLFVSHSYVGGSMHSEIFTFNCLTSHLRGCEWALIVRPVLKQWTAFVSLML